MIAQRPLQHSPAMAIFPVNIERATLAEKHLSWNGGILPSKQDMPDIFGRVTPAIKFCQVP